MSFILQLLLVYCFAFFLCVGVCIAGVDLD